jgi:hypothetical protein
VTLGLPPALWPMLSITPPFSGDPRIQAFARQWARTYMCVETFTLQWASSLLGVTPPVGILTLMLFPPIGHPDLGLLIASAKVYASHPERTYVSKYAHKGKAKPNCAFWLAPKPECAALHLLLKPTCKRSGQDLPNFPHVAHQIHGTMSMHSGLRPNRSALHSGLRQTGVRSTLRAKAGMHEVCEDIPVTPRGLQLRSMHTKTGKAGMHCTPALRQNRSAQHSGLRQSRNWQHLELSENLQACTKPRQSDVRTPACAKTGVHSTPVCAQAGVRSTSTLCHSRSA